MTREYPTAAERAKIPVRPGEPWFVVITRCELDGRPWREDDIVIGPFPTEPAALEHLEESLDVEDWVTAEAKAAGYIVDDAFITQDPPEVFHGVLAPAYLA